MSNSFSYELDAPQECRFQEALNFEVVGMYEQPPHRYSPKSVFPPSISNSIIGDRDLGLYVQTQPQETTQLSQQLLTLQRLYSFLSDACLIADVLAKVPVLYILLKEAVGQLQCVFGKSKLLQLEALASDEDTVLRVMVKLSKDTKTPAALMRRFKQEWWLKNCSQSEASLVFDYEIGNGF